MPAYTVAGEPIPDGRGLRLRGYPGGTARAANRVIGQFQLDGLGEILDLFAAAARLDLLAEENWHAATTVAEAIEKRWHEPDAGIWELDDRHWTHSRLACVSGLRSLAAAAQGPPGGHGHRQAARWSALADSILASLGDSVHATGRWQRSPEDARIDAALLLPVIRGTLPADDPRIRATVRAVQDELTEDGYVYRFRHDARPLHKSEGAFLLCGFWMAQVAQVCGDGAAAGRWFERNRAACGPAGLYTEEYDVHQRQLRGNLPQGIQQACLVMRSMRARFRGYGAGRRRESDGGSGGACARNAQVSPRGRPPAGACTASPVVLTCTTGGTVAGAGRLAVCFFAGLWFALPLDRRRPVPAIHCGKPDCPACRG
jgi:alpha,alpha-trehalase